MLRFVSIWIVCLFAWISPRLALAETAEVRLVKQPGLASLPLVVMEQLKLYEKHLAAAGLKDTKVSWQRILGGAMINDALLAGNLDFATAGAVPLATIWSRTRGTALEVKGVCGVNSVPITLSTRNPAVRSIADFTERDRIAVPAIKISIQAVILQMAAAKQWGEKDLARLDNLTTPLGGADAFAAITSGSEVSAVMSTPPFTQMLRGKPGIREILNSYDVLGGPHNINVIYTTSKFRSENPKTYAAFIAAFEEATNFVIADKRAAAQAYLKASPEPIGVDALVKIIEDPQVRHGLAPQGVMKLVTFAYASGALKVKPETWKDMFFPEAHGLDGN